MAAAVDKVNGMSQERKSFTVNDRRHFTSEGEPREDPEDEVLPSPPEGEASRARTAEEAASATHRGSEVAQTFGAFILSLASQAGHLLASEGEEAAAGLEGARQLIAIIEMLKEKTEGRRTEGESQIIEAVLYELRMGYVARTRAGGA